MATSGNTTDQTLPAAESDTAAALAQLETQHRDRLTPLAKGIVGACPVIGPMLAEIVGVAVPNQRVERIVAFLQTIDERLARAEADLDRFHLHLQTPEGIDLLEESMMQATRAITSERQQRLGRLLTNALTQEELRYQETKKLLGLLRELTDPELLWLVYYSEPVTFSSEFHDRLKKQHHDVFAPASNLINAPDDELDRGAIQASYKNTLQRYGLLEQNDRQQFQITRLGKILFRYLEDQASE